MRALTALLVLALALPVACGREKSEPAAAPAAPPPVGAPAPSAARVSGIEIGTAVDTDGRVTAPTSVFSPGDTIYAAVVTEGQSPGSTLSARWTYEDGQLVSENLETLGAPGKVQTEFHIAKPDGWPAGRYRVEIALDGQPAGAREFEVR
jgi:hypothetical protein